MGLLRVTFSIKKMNKNFIESELESFFYDRIHNLAKG